MKLGAVITSERGQPVTKTGNEYINIEVLDDNREVIAIMQVYTYKDSIGSGYKADIQLADHCYGKISGENIENNQISKNSPFKCKFCGNDKFIVDNEGDRYCENLKCEMYEDNDKLKHDKSIRCNNCMNKYAEEELLQIEDMRACPKCSTDKYLMNI